MLTPYYRDEQVTLHHGDALATLQELPDESVDSCVTSPPYFGLRDYGSEGQYGLEESPAIYVQKMRTLFSEVRRTLADDGTLWLNLGDSYSANSDGYERGKDYNGGRQPLVRPKTRLQLPPKNLIGIPWRVAFALQDDGWILRNAVVWHKPNGMPTSVQDRFATKYELVFLFSKARFYWFDVDAVRVPHAPANIHRYATPLNPQDRPQAKTTGVGRDGIDGGHAPSKGANPGDVWTLPPQPFAEAHFAVMPPALAERCVLAGCKPGGTVLDPFSGSGTTGYAANKHGRKYVGIDLNADYLDLSLRTRFAQPGLDLNGGAA